MISTMKYVSHLHFLAIFILSIGCAETNPDGPTASPEYMENVIFQSGAEYFTFRIPSLLELPNGDLLAFAEGRESLADEGDIDLVMKRSSDNGATWGDLQVIIDNGTDTAGNPAPVVDQTTGRIWMPYCTNPGEDPYARRVWVTYSDDNGETWAESKEITDDVKPAEWKWYATGPGRSIQLSTGRLLVPANHNSEGNVRQAHVFYSDDYGETWQVGASTGVGTDESQVVELSDGTVMMNSRYTGPEHLRAVTLSTDGGESWGETILDETLIDPICQGSLLMTDQGLLFVNPATQQEFPRDHLSIRISDDEGKTWPYMRELDDGPSAYSALGILANGHFGVVWESGDLLPYEKIRFAAFNRSWVLAQP